MQRRAFIPTTFILVFLTSTCLASRFAGSINPAATLALATPSPSTVDASPLPPVEITRESSATPANPSPAQQTDGTKRKAFIYLVALEGAGRSGKAIGCGDSVVPVSRSISPTGAVLRAALAELLTIHDPYYGDSGLYNALYQSRLRIDSLSLEQGTAGIYLQGGFTLGGVCDSPRVKAQLEETALQFTTVQRVRFWVNDVPLDDLLSGQG